MQKSYYFKLDEEEAKELDGMVEAADSNPAAYLKDMITRLMRVRQLAITEAKDSRAHVFACASCYKTYESSTDPEYLSCVRAGHFVLNIAHFLKSGP